MKYLLAVVIAWGVVPNSSWAQTQKKSAKPQTQSERKLRFDVLDTPFQIRLPLADPVMLEQKVVSSFRIAIPRVPFPGNSIRSSVMISQRLGREQPASVERDLDIIRGTFLAFEDFRGISPQKRRPSRSVAESVSRLKKHTPKDKLPTGVLEQFVELGVRLDYFAYMVPHAAEDGERDNAGRTVDHYLEVRFIAPSVEQAQDKARGFMTLVDHGFYRAMQGYYRGLASERDKELADLNKQLTSYQKDLISLESEIGKIEEISSESLITLRTQQWQLEVDIAGAKARIKTCESILSKRAASLKPSVVSQVENLKIGAEIDLAGLAAKKSRLDAFITRGTARVSLEKKISSLRGTRVSSSTLRGREPVTGSRTPRRGMVDVEYRINRARESVAGYHDLIAAHAPPLVLRDTVEIRPIEWLRQSE